MQSGNKKTKALPVLQVLQKFPTYTCAIFLFIYATKRQD